MYSGARLQNDSAAVTLLSSVQHACVEPVIESCTHLSQVARTSGILYAGTMLAQSHMATRRHTDKTAVAQQARTNQHLVDASRMSDESTNLRA
jgi:hypothetical protein